ncbi:acyl-CoA/acyl-ACP dehydrogenase [Nitratireductor mangrovi]|uniref:Acyl-CoA/acyl-ACP dehydrogenase n=1 Tax=Nitratireductor mangrovi TaxID=2599600 RepID=A0A5B8L2I5_9HYPH|nr:acyl-CoA dehydrogenase family protein [Nitratireductor mangrovi]QDZ02009.1 acyl-CoA/acyl-ACP dehydrogenase [Nitratireductor mangrovi]
MTEKIDLQHVLAEVGPAFSDGVAERDREAVFVAGHYDMLRRYKVFSAIVPLELGGGGASHGEMCAFIRGLAHHCSATALALSMHQHLVAAAVFNDRNGKPGRKLLEKVAGNETILVSTGANDWLSSNGTVEKADGGYLVSARKPFASGSPKGDVLVTSAPWQNPNEGWQVLHFPVPMRAEGVSLGGDWDTLGMRATGSETVILDKVFVAEDAVVLKRPRDAYHPAFSVILTVAMPLIVSAYVGVAEAAADIARGLAVKRADDPATPYLLGELENRLTTAQIAVDDMARITNDWAFAPTPANANAILVRKSIAAGAIIATVEKALEVAGGAGFYRKIGLERLLRDAHGVQFHPLPEKRQQQFTGRLALGLEPIDLTGTETSQARRAA